MDPVSYTVRSFRTVFELERRLFRVDRWRLPFPHGVPLRGVAYGACALVAVLALGGLPGVGELLGLLPPPLRLVVAPGAIAYALARANIDGRPAHRTAIALVRATVGSRRLVAFRPARRTVQLRCGGVTLFPDERTREHRRAVLDGPAQVLLRYPARARRSGVTLSLERLPGRLPRGGKRIALQRGQRIVFR